MARKEPWATRIDAPKDDVRTVQYIRQLGALQRRLEYTFSDSGRNLALQALTDMSYARSFRQRQKVPGANNVLEYQGDKIFNRAIQVWADALPVRDKSRVDRRKLVFFLQSNAFLSIVGSRLKTASLLRVTDRVMAHSAPLSQIRIFSDSIEALLKAIEIDSGSKEVAQKIALEKILPQPGSPGNLYRDVIDFCDATDESAVMRGWEGMTNKKATMDVQLHRGVPEAHVTALDGYYVHAETSRSLASAAHFAGFAFMKAHPWSLWKLSGPGSPRPFFLKKSDNFRNVDLM
jgi:dsRNA-specific ribonuclease